MTVTFGIKHFLHCYLFYVMVEFIGYWSESPVEMANDHTFNNFLTIEPNSDFYNIYKFLSFLSECQAEKSSKTARKYAESEIYLILSKARFHGSQLHDASY